MRCLLCLKEMGKGSIRDILWEEDLICEECRRQWERKDIRFQMDGITVRSDYVYNKAFSSCLIQYKELCDEALKDVFVKEVRKKMKRRYHGYTLCMMPSSNSKVQARGFHHLQGMYESIGLPILDPFEKIDERDQKKAGRQQRQMMMKDIRLKEGIDLPKKIVLCDDTITTGSTLKGALACIDRARHKIQIYCVSANRLWLKQ